MKGSRRRETDKHNKAIAGDRQTDRTTVTRQANMQTSRQARTHARRQAGRHARKHASTNAANRLMFCMKELFELLHSDLVIGGEKHIATAHPHSQRERER